MMEEPEDLNIRIETPEEIVWREAKEASEERVRRTEVSLELEKVILDYMKNRKI